MAYNIYRADGTAIVVPDNSIDSQFYNASANGSGKGQGTQLVGRNAIDYGAPTAQNFLQLTENFASNNIVPSDTTSSIGQLWFNKSTSSLFVKVTASAVGINNWSRLVALNPAGTAANGDINISGTGASLTISIYADGAWRQLFPAVYS